MRGLGSALRWLCHRRQGRVGWACLPSTDHAERTIGLKHDCAKVAQALDALATDRGQNLVACYPRTPQGDMEENAIVEK